VGDIVVAGWTEGSLGGPNEGVVDAFIVKYASDGTERWRRQLGSTVIDLVEGVAINDAGDVVIAGYTPGSLGGPNNGGWDVFVAAYSSDGRLLWTRQPGTTVDDWTYGVTIDAPTGNVILGWKTDDDLIGEVSFFSVYSASGTLLGTQPLPRSPDDEYTAVFTTDGAGNVYTAGMLPSQSEDAFFFVAKYAPLLPCPPRAARVRHARSVHRVSRPTKAGRFPRRVPATANEVRQIGALAVIDVGRVPRAALRGRMVARRYGAVYRTMKMDLLTRGGHNGISLRRRRRVGLGLVSRTCGRARPPLQLTPEVSDLRQQVSYLHAEEGRGSVGFRHQDRHLVRCRKTPARGGETLPFDWRKALDDKPEAGELDVLEAFEPLLEPLSLISRQRLPGAGIEAHFGCVVFRNTAA
jgi:hypothetical protein